MDLSLAALGIARHPAGFFFSHQLRWWFLSFSKGWKEIFQALEKICDNRL